LAGVGLGALLVVLVGTILYTQPTGSLAAFGFSIEDIVGARWRNPAQAKPPVAPLETTAPYEERVTERELSSETPAPKPPEFLSSEPNPAASPAPRIDNTDRLLTPLTEATGRKAEDSGTSKTNASTRNLNPVQPFIHSEKLEFEVYKALYNRAIRGVEVSVRDGTIVLAGRVATENQKLAAVQAASSVPGVRGIRDEITVNN
jgi:hypothetical protein